MTDKTSKVKIKPVKQGDSQWMIKDDIRYVPRAGFEINHQCPKEYRLIIAECISKGWLTPIAYMRDDEYMWEELKT